MDDAQDSLQLWYSLLPEKAISWSFLKLLLCLIWLMLIWKYKTWILSFLYSPPNSQRYPTGYTSTSSLLWIQKCVYVCVCICVCVCVCHAYFSTLLFLFLNICIAMWNIYKSINQLVWEKCNMSHKCIFEFSGSHILREKKKQVELLLIIYFIYHGTSKILSFQHVMIINIWMNEIFLHSFFLLNYSNSNVCFTLIAHLSSDFFFFSTVQVLSSHMYLLDNAGLSHQIKG